MTARGRSIAAIAIAIGGLSGCRGERARPPDAAPAPSAPYFSPPAALHAAAPDAGTFTPGACAPTAGRKSFDVGDGQPYPTLSDVPWTRIGWGDAVRIHWRPTPYREKIVVTASGKASDPLRICGVPGPNGERPILDGENATTSSKAAFAHEAHEARGLVTFSAERDAENGKKPRNVVLQGLELRNAGEGISFKNSKGVTQKYAENAACIFVERGEHLRFVGNDVHGCGNGIFVASGGDEASVSRDILVEGNDIHHNGSTGRGKDRHHNAYTEALGIVYQFNRFGPVREGSQGIQLKDRSAGNVIRYNWFEGGQRVLDLVEAEESSELAKREPAFRKTFVYGNVIHLGKDASSRVIHYGGDNGDTGDYRRGTLYFYGNTVVIDTRASDQYNIALFFLEKGETADVRNNVIYGSNDAHLFWLFEGGDLKLGANWVSRGIGLERDKSTAKVEHVLGADKTILGAGAPFVDASAGDYCLAPSSPARGAAGPLASVAKEMALTLQYGKHRVQRPRASSADLGALACDPP